MCRIKYGSMYTLSMHLFMLQNNITNQNHISEMRKKKSVKKMVIFSN